jgi:hypothetical protein
MTNLPLIVPHQTVHEDMLKKAAPAGLYRPAGAAFLSMSSCLLSS